MDTNQQDPSAGSSKAPARDRLESWKGIAAYLRRDIRTLRRWEKNEGLPVHRHMHDKLPTVYAYKAELDAWWANRRPKLEAEEPKEANQKSKRWLLAVAAAAAVVVAAGVGYWWSRPPALPFEERDWVLIAQFENRTGEEVFDGTLEYALERELSNSRFVNVVPRERINDALQLMRKPPDTTVDRSIGREVCLRDGGIRTLITGRVEKLDTTYVLSAALVNPSNGVTVVSFSEEAVGQREVVPAIRRLSNRVRETLGEELISIPQSEHKLERVTSPSLRALKLFTQADAVIAFENNALAEELLRQAVVEDPEFASGYMHLAYAIANQGRPREEWLPYAQKALELSERASERERYFILGSYYQMAGQPQKAMAVYETLLRVYPDHFWANANKRVRLYRQGRYREAARQQVHEAQLRPNSFRINLHAAGELIRWGSHPFEAQPYVQGALQLASSEAARDHARDLAWLELYSAREHWLEGDLEKALQEATRLSQQLRSRSGPERDLLAYNLRQFYFTLGKLKAAEELSQDPDARVAIAFARDNHQALHDCLRQALGSGEEAVGPFEMILSARLGMVPEAEKALAIIENRDFTAPWRTDIEKKHLTEGIRKVARGELGLARGRTAEAIRVLEEGFNLIPPHGFTTYFLAAESLAQAYEQQGDLGQAVDVLRKAGEEKRRAVYFGGLSTLLWMRIQLRLADLYRNQGREGQAQEIEAELSQLLAYADPDHAILRGLKTNKDVTSRSQ
ncbi:MAG: tetratricopeptide repeat protein [Acidobacteriota bacterium]|nr:tetratricopeptide repeat protein [Acidobacteriota bacterium]